MKKAWFLRALKIIKDNVIMKKHNALKLTMFFLGISLTLAFHYVGPSNVMAYGAPYDGFVTDIDTGIITAWGGGAGYPPLFSTNGYQWSYSPSYDYGHPLSYYNSYGGFGYGYQQPYNPYGYQQSYNYGWNQPSYGWNQPSYGWNQPSYDWSQPSYGWNQPYSYGWSWNYGWSPYAYGGYSGYGYPGCSSIPYGGPSGPPVIPVIPTEDFGLPGGDKLSWLF